MSARAAVLSLVAAASGCALWPHGTREVPAFRVAPAPFVLRIGAEGVLEAADATPIQAPNLRVREFLAWLAPDGAHVEKGAELVRIDGKELAELVRRSRARIDRIDRELAAKRRALAKEKRSIEGEIALVEQQLRFAEMSAPRDPELFSRMERIDAEVNRRLLQAKKEHLHAQLERYRKRAEAEIDILRSKRKTEQVALQQLEEDRARLVVRAPHAGVFLHRRNRRGEKIRVGSRVWGGQKVADLTGLERMQAKVEVLESEAAGLAVGLSAVVVPEAFPELRFTGRVERVQPVAAPIEEGSPVKYFEVVLAIDEVDREHLRPGGRVRAWITVQRVDRALSVPNQALFHDKGRTVVFVDRGGRFEPQPVELGPRSVSRSVIRSGLEPGDRVALVDPREERS